jgi:hypothetical protein
MQYISRQSQLQSRKWDPFSPVQRVSVNQFGIMKMAASRMLTDALLDGIEISAKPKVAKWLDENYVHHAKVLSEQVNSTRFLLGAQVVAGRDDIKKLSHILVVEKDRLVRVTLYLSCEIERLIVHHGIIRRAHLTINKFSGYPHVAYVASNDAGSSLLFLDGKQINTSSQDVDFPFMALCQASIGQVQKSQPKYGLLSYKCRTSGKVFLREISQDGAVGSEREIAAPNCLGGIDFAISGDRVLFRADAIETNSLITRIASSGDKGATLSTFEKVDLGDFEPDEHLPTTCPVFQDYLGNFHVPVATQKDDKRHLFDVMDDLAVESMTLSTRGFGYTLARFPKKPEMEARATPRGRGDGSTDGVGIIATAMDQGQLLVSNSQSGGATYPQERLLNHEMPKIFSFKATECCYTRNQVPNTVSMDYVFIECDENGAPISNELLIETWDMPLPIPIIEAKANGSNITVNIIKDAWFENGRTIFNFDDLSIEISAVNYINERTVEITTNNSALAGKKITFETKNAFYWHEGSSIIT